MNRSASTFRVCLLTETYHPVTGGGETQARTLAEGLNERGATIHLITRRSDPQSAKRESVGGVEVRRVAPAGRGRLRKWGMLVTAFLALLRLKNHYDVLLVCGFRLLGIPALLACSILRKGCVLKADSQGELSGAFFDPGLERLRLRHDRLPVSLAVRLRNALLRRADRFVAISLVIEREYVLAGIPDWYIERIPNSVDTKRFCPATTKEKETLRAGLDLPMHRPIAVFTGRLVTTKGLPSLLRAWPTVLADRSNALLVLVGSGGLGLQNCETYLRQEVERQQLHDFVRFTGSVSDVSAFLRASDVFVFPTEREAFGISVIEAMAVGLPIVTTGIDGVRDILRPEVDGIVVPPGNDAALARAILRALEGGKSVSAMADSACRRAREHFSNERVIDAYQQLLGEVVRR